jgi:pimeloyl-ACP methyl ester carboxylesterase
VRLGVADSGMRMFLLMILSCAVGLVQTWAQEGHFSADLPDVLTMSDGRRVETAADWPSRRAELGQLWQDTYLGRFPKERPRLVSASLKNLLPRRSGTSAKIELTFDCPKQPLTFEITLLQRTHDGTPQPLILTQPRHYQMAWADAAAARGYLVCLYPGVDYNHKEEAFPGYENVWKQVSDAYPDLTWHSSLAIQSWIASLAIDFLLSPQKFEKPALGLTSSWRYPIIEDQIGIIGHSRYGKQALYAAAFDERFTAVLARSSGSPTAAGYRFTGRHTFMETTHDFPAEWALSGVKDYFGRENRLPVEGNGLLAMIAPRACRLHTAYHDGGDPTFAVERTYRSAKQAYQLLGAGEKLTLQYREGNHNPITETHVEENLDWFDEVFGREKEKSKAWQETLLHDFDWPKWKAQQRPADLVVPHAEAPLLERVRWMLGEGSEAELSLDDISKSGVGEWSRDRWKPDGVVRHPIQFGDGVSGNLMYSKQAAESGEALPVVIWLHPFNYSHGYNEGYGVEGTTIYYRLAQVGYAVLCYDQLGFGDRLLEGPRFDKAHPHGSRLGRMVHDVHRAVDFITAFQSVPKLSFNEITLLGYSLGGMVALHAAALDDRISGVATFSGFTPMRTDTIATGGNRRWWEWHALLPKLGLFDGAESEIPYDYHHLIQAISPRPVLIVAPTKDWHSDAKDVEACVAKSQHPSITLETPEDTNRFQSAQLGRFITWLEAIDE